MSESLRSPMPPRAGGSSTSSTCALCSPRRRPSCAAPSPGRSHAAPTTARTSPRRRTCGRRTSSAPGTKGATCTCGPNPWARCRRRYARPSKRTTASTTTTWSREVRGGHGRKAVQRDGLSEFLKSYPFEGRADVESHELLIPHEGALASCVPYRVVESPVQVFTHALVASVEDQAALP